MFRFMGGGACSAPYPFTAPWGESITEYVDRWPLRPGEFLIYDGSN